MGLDQYAYVASRSGVLDEYYQQLDGSTTTKIAQPRELAYWRKHPNLQGWMKDLWLKKLAAEGKKPDDSDAPTFNGIELELTWDDLDGLERAVRNRQLPKTVGFFFGNESDDYYREHDLEFIRNARAELFLGLKVFYNSSW
jgi:hypothetical protein